MITDSRLGDGNLHTVAILLGLVSLDWIKNFFELRTFKGEKSELCLVMTVISIDVLKKLFKMAKQIVLYNYAHHKHAEPCTQI